MGCTAEQASWWNPGSVSSSVRVPPPILSCASYTVTRQPCRASATAAASPFGPAPTTLTVASLTLIPLGGAPACAPASTMVLMVLRGRDSGSRLRELAIGRGLRPDSATPDDDLNEALQDPGDLVAGAVTERWAGSAGARSTPAGAIAVPAVEMRGAPTHLPACASNGFCYARSSFRSVPGRAPARGPDETGPSSWCSSRGRVRQGWRSAWRWRRLMPRRRP